MADWTKEVFSTMVSSIAYDGDTGDMTVTWAKGGSGVYSGVPEDLALQLVNAPSVGGMINSEFKNVFPYRRA